MLYVAPNISDCFGSATRKLHSRAQPIKPCKRLLNDELAIFRSSTEAHNAAPSTDYLRHLLTYSHIALYVLEKHNYEIMSQ